MFYHTSKILLVFIIPKTSLWQVLLEKKKKNRETLLQLQLIWSENKQTKTQEGFAQSFSIITVLYL